MAGTSISRKQWVASILLSLLAGASAPAQRSVQPIQATGFSTLIGPEASSSSVSSSSSELPEAPLPSIDGQATAVPGDDLPLRHTPERLLSNEWHIVTSPARIHKADLRWLLPLAGATAAAIATDTRAMRNVVSTNPDFNNSNNTTSGALRDVFIGAPILLFGAGELTKHQTSRNTGLLAGEAMINAYVTSEAIKYITLRERPQLNNARGHFFTGDSVSDPSFVSGHSIVAWSSAAVLAGQYSKPWEQIGIYGAASAVSVTRVLAQQHFPSDVLIGSVSGWLIGHYVFKTHKSPGGRSHSLVALRREPGRN